MGGEILLNTYSALKIDDTRRKEICTNYLEGSRVDDKLLHRLACIDWRWTYKYDYPPLLSDLAKYIPYFDTRLIESKAPDPVSQLVQLSYVLPRDSMSLLPEMISEGSSSMNIPSGMRAIMRFKMGVLQIFLGVARNYDRDPYTLHSKTLLNNISYIYLCQLRYSHG